MPQEKETYRDNLKRFCDKFPHKEVLNIKDVCKFTGMSKEFARKAYPLSKKRVVSNDTLAEQKNSPIRAVTPTGAKQKYYIFILTN